jgi:hypothetical protein
MAKMEIPKWAEIHVFLFSSSKAIIHVADQIIHPGWMIIHHHPIIHPSGTSLNNTDWLGFRAGWFRCSQYN